MIRLRTGPKKIGENDAARMEVWGIPPPMGADGTFTPSL